MSNLILDHRLKGFSKIVTKTNLCNLPNLWEKSIALRLHNFNLMTCKKYLWNLPNLRVKSIAHRLMGFAQIVAKSNLCNLSNLLAKLLVIILISINTKAYAQTTHNLNDAITIAIQNNTQLKNEQLKKAYAKAIISTAKEIPKTNVFTELGQVNSVLFDNKFGIAQNIPFPTIYKRQKQVYEIDFSIAKANVLLKEYELKKAITELYYQYQFLKEKEALLNNSDTLFTNFYNKASLRLQKGESNILEKTTAENQKLNIELQLQQLRQEINVLLIRFRYLLNEVDAVPYTEPNYLFCNIDTLAISSHPILAIYKGEINLAIANTALEKEKLKPDFNVGINNTSFRGIAPNNITYNGLNRFSSLQLGIAIPIFAKSQKQKIKALQVKENLASSKINIAEEKLKVEFEKWLLQYKSNKEILEGYKSNTLKNAALIKQTANKQFINGEINYLDYVMLIHQAIGIESNYIDLRQAVNNSILQLNFITFPN